MRIQERKTSPTEHNSNAHTTSGNARLALPILLLLLVGFTFASNNTYGASCGILPSAISSLILTCNSINITNTQAVATPAGFDQMLTNLPFNALAGNVVVYNGISGNLLNSWAENAMTIWVNLGANTINAYSSANGIYYVGLGSSSTSFLDPTFSNDIGVCPTCSSSYGKYDNGNTVFPFYQNFYGVTLGSGWTSGITSVVVSNGLTLTQGGSWADMYNSYTSAIPTIVEANIISTGTKYWSFGFGNSAGSNGASGMSFYSMGSSVQGVGIDGGSSGGLSYSFPTAPFITGVGLASATTGNYFTRYVTWNGITTASTAITNPSFGVYNGGSGSEILTAQWIRERAYPPNGVMPTVVYGATTLLSGTLSVKLNSIITGGAETWYFNISNIGYGTVNSVLLALGNQSLAFGTVLTNKYYYALSSFVPSSFGIANPTGINSISVPYSVNAMVTTNGIASYINANGAFTVNAPDLLGCTAYTGNAFAWNFYNATNLQPIGENVLLTGYFYIKNGLYTSNTIQGTSAGLSATATSNTYATCMFPTWNTFDTFGTFIYGSSNYSSAQFLLVNQSTSNVVVPIKLYEQQITNPSSYDIVVEQGINNPISAYVQELIYNINLNKSVLVNEFQTPSGGGYVVPLQTNSYYQFKAFNSNGQLLNSTSLLQASCASGTTCAYYIQVGNLTQIVPTQYLGNVKFSCTTTPGGVNTSIESCSVASLNGASLTANLTVWQDAIYQNTQVCSHSVSSASLNLVCTVPNTNNHTFIWQLSLSTPYGTQVLQNGNFGQTQSLFGNLGIIIAILIVAAMGLIFISVNPGVAVVLAIVGMIISGALAFITLNVDAAGFLIVFGAIIVFALRSRG
jgi:hypothetical protein